MTASYGQGIAMSPIAITRALAALGNGGVLVQPHVVREIKHTVGSSKNTTPKKTERVFSEETSETITQMLINVVDDALVGGTVALPHHTIAAKTGTAQIADSATGGYAEDKFLHSFFGYFPAYNPEFIVFLYHIDPRGADYASQTLTKPFMSITKFLINYYNIAPDR
jgi:cell division protein FtsI/penicillin-binding protein 2